MLFFGIKNFWFRVGIASLFAVLTAVFIVLMYRNYYIFDPYDPTLTGTARYGHNGEGEFSRYLLMTLIELGVLNIVLLPFSFSRFYWIRCLILLFFFSGWMMLMAVAGMHSGGVNLLHTLWLVIINIMIFVLLVASIVAEYLNRRKNQAMSRN